MYNIEKNVPIPRSAHRKYPFLDMEKGDSVFLPVKGHVFSGSISHAARVLKAKFVTRQVTENGKHGVRVWRVK